MPPPIEPSLAHFASRPWRARFAATRPAFLSITVVAVAVGLAASHAAGATLRPGLALLTLALALLVHAAANVVNDYHDALGSDAVNTARLFPFSGGSRFIQNGVLDRAATGRLAAALFALSAAGGLWLVLGPAPGLLVVGLAGLLVGWAYSAPPLSLASRGIGELAVAAAWMLVVIGSDTVQRGSAGPFAIAAGACCGATVACVLFVNQFPDAAADRIGGKRTLVVRLGARRAAAGFAILTPVLHGLPLLMVLSHRLAPACAIACVSVWPAMRAVRSLCAAVDADADRFDREAMAAAIRLMLLAAHLNGAGLAIGLIVS